MFTVEFNEQFGWLILERGLVIDVCETEEEALLYVETMESAEEAITHPNCSCNSASYREGQFYLNHGECEWCFFVGDDY